MHRLKLNPYVWGVLIFIFCISDAVAGEKVVERQVVATGETREGAIVNGLIEAQRQIGGMSLQSEERLRSVFKESVVSENGITQDAASGINILLRDVSTKTGGYIKSYEIVRADQDLHDHTWDVTLLVRMASYQTPGLPPEGRRKIAIIPFRTSMPFYKCGEHNIPAKELARQFAQKLVNEFTQVRRFSVLDREYVEEFLAEKRLLLSPDAPVSEQVKLGQVLGVDYLLLGTITELEVRKHPYRIPLTGESGVRLSATLKADFRIVVMATRQIKWSDSVSMCLDHDRLMALAPSGAIGAVLDNMLAASARRISVGALDNIYPIRVIKKTKNGEVILNQGGITLSKGDVLDVYRPGETVRDPYTGESLGSVEEWAGTIAVRRVTPKMSYATLIKNGDTQIQEGSICRRKIASIHKKTVGKARPADRGVRLPFDH